MVDDEKEVGELIAEVLPQDGFKVTVARSGEEALKQLKKRSFALILERPEDAQYGWPAAVQPHLRPPPGRGASDWPS